MIYALLGLVVVGLVVGYWAWIGKVRYEYLRDLALHASEADRSPVEVWEAPKVVRGPYDWEGRGDFDDDYS